GWGGPISWLVTCGYVATESQRAWLSCLAMICLVNGVHNLVPVPGLSGGKLGFLAWEVLTGQVSEKLETRMTLVGVLSLYAGYGFLLWLDVVWISSLIQG
ncbi:MAG: site-2 protease family protein, partial [Planctomycetota bacterium]